MRGSLAALKRLSPGLAVLALATAAHAGAYRAPRTPWGAPNLQGMWSNGALTRLERPAGVPARLPAGADLAAIEKAVLKSIIPSDPLGSRQSEDWPPDHLARMDGELRTSWIDSTADGRIPYRPEAAARLAAIRAAALVDFDGPEVAQHQRALRDPRASRPIRRRCRTRPTRPTTRSSRPAKRW